MSTTAIVTGASAGLGEVFARRLAARGHALILTARRAERLDALADALRRDHGVHVTVVAADLEQPEARDAVMAAVDAAPHPLALLVNNAGFGATGRFDQLDLARNLGQVRLNMEALTHLTWLALPRLLARGDGAVLNIASTAAFQPGPFMAVYCATKAYVLSLSEALAEELRGTGVRVVCHCPGPTRTEFAQVARDGASVTLGTPPASADDVVDDALRALDAGRVVAVHGLANTAATWLVPFLPRAAVRSMAARLLRPPDAAA